MAVGISFFFSLYLSGCKFSGIVDMALFVDVKSQEWVRRTFTQNMDLFIIRKTFVLI